MTFDPKRTAFLSLDLQKGILANYPATEATVIQAAKALDFARKVGAHVIHVGLGFAEGHPEIPDTQPLFSNVKKNNVFVIGSPSAEFDPRTVKAGDVVIHKHRISAFTSNQLDLVLRAKGVTELVLFGVATSGIVLSTVLEAFDNDYLTNVLTDACFDPDPEVHEVLTTKIFAKRGQVHKVDEFIGAWNARK